MGAISTGLNTKVGAGATQAFDPGDMTGGTVGGFLNPLGNNTKNLLGLPGAAPVGANIQQGTDVGDVNRAQSGVTDALSGQQGLLNALQAQNGLGNQSALMNQLNTANGVGTQNSAISGLQNTAGMYQNMANGVGANPAQAMLNNATGANVANQAALMAGQRGAGANVGLMARQAGQQGAGIQQQAAGQAALQQAQQQLAGLGGLSNTQQAIGNLGSGQLAAQQGMANQLAGQQVAGVGANTQAHLANQQQMQNALQGINTSNVASQGNVNAGNVGLATTNAQGKQGMIGGLMNGIGGAAGSMFGAGGGEVNKMAMGGDPGFSAPLQQPAPAIQEEQFGPASSFGQFLQNPNPAMQSLQPMEDHSYEDYANAKPKGEQKKEKSGLEKIIPIVAMAAMAAKGGLAKTGGHVSAKASDQKAVKKGNSYDNDKVPAMLSEQEIVLPRSVTLGPDPVNDAAKFVAKVLAKRRYKK